MSTLVRSKKQKGRSASGGSTLYRQVEQAIVAEIRSGKLKPGDRLGSTEELAAKWNVSPSTVRQSLQMLASMGVLIRKPRVGTVVASESERSSSGNEFKGADASVGGMIALLVPDITHYEYSCVAKAIQDAVHALGMDVMVGSTDDRVEKYEEIISRQIRNDIFGLVLVPPWRGQLSARIIAEIQKHEIPVVTVYRSIVGAVWPRVYSDYYHSNYTTAKHLCDIGCKHIAYCAELETEESGSVKHYAFLRALIDSGRTIHPALTMFLPPKPYSGDTLEFEKQIEQQLNQWLIEHPEIDGINCAHDEIAFHVLKALRKLGRSVPGDVAVTGEGNIAKRIDTESGFLTTIDGCYVGIAEQVVRLLVDMHHGKPMSSGMSYPVKGNLILGRSTARA